MDILAGMWTDVNRGGKCGGGGGKGGDVRRSGDRSGASRVGERVRLCYDARLPALYLQDG